MTTTTQSTGAEEVAWDLSDLYDSSDDPKLQGELDEAKQATATFRERYRGKVAELDAADLAEAVAERERIESLLDRPMTFAQLRFSTNMADPPRGALVQRIQEESAALSTELLFFGLEWAAVDDAHAERVLADPAVAEYRHWLEALRRYRPHLLTEPEERIMTEKSVSGSSSWSRLYSELLGSLRAELDGEEQSMEVALARLQDADRDVRRTAAEAVTEGLQPGLRTRAFVFNAILLDKSIDDRLRGYPTWISARNLANEVSDEAVQALVDAVVSRYDVPQRYYQLKARLLGLDRLAHYDRVAPFTEETSFTTWDEARRIVRRRFRRLQSDEAGDIVESLLRAELDRRARPARQVERRLLRDDRPGRAPVRADELHRRPPLDPDARARARPRPARRARPAARALQRLDAADAGRDGVGVRRVADLPLAHGGRDRPAPPARPPGRPDRGRDRHDLAPDRDEPLRGGRAHRAGATRASSRRTRSRRRGSRRRTSSSATRSTRPATTPGGATCPHFASVPGYVYAYAYGYLFSLAIYRRYEREGDAMVEPYFDLLRKGGSETPEQLAEIVGLDLSDPAIWASGIEALDELLGEAEALADEAL